MFSIHVNLFLCADCRSGDRFGDITMVTLWPAARGEALEKQIHHFQGKVGFGIGKIWTGEVTKWPWFLHEFFGSLLTGILVSIGVPYWHDL